MSASTEWKKLREKAVNQGFRVEGGGKRHWKVLNPAGQLVCVIPNTPGRGRAYLNQVSQLRRAGVKI